MFSFLSSKTPPREFIQVKAKKGEPGAFAITHGKTNSWVKTIPNPNFKPAEAPAPAAAPPSAPAPEPYTPKPLVAEGSGSTQSSLTIASAPEPPPPPKPTEFSPGGVGSSLDGNASGFRRKKSSARMSGLTTKGTGRFKIGGGQTSSSSGLNIGV